MSTVYPYLPNAEVTCIIGDIKTNNITVLVPPEIKALPEGLRRHADLGICMVDETAAVCAPETYDYYFDLLKVYNIRVIRGEKKLGGTYPDDSAYNACVVGDKCFVNEKICDPCLYRILKRKGYDIINVNQGYTKCSICPVNKNTIITADIGIYSKAASHGVEVLLIENDGIKLSGYKNGFFGGATGMISSDKLAVNGELKFIKDGEKIEKFLKSKGVMPISLKKGKICDIGSIIPLTANVHNI